jgi:hypothetical protein
MGNTTAIFQAPPVTWEQIEHFSHTQNVSAAILELRDRVAALEAARAEQQQQEATTEDSSAAHSEPASPDAPQTLHDVALAHVDTLGRYFDILPAILDTIRRAIREPMAGPACPHIRSSGDSNWCALAEQQAHTEPAPTEPAPLPPIRVGQKWRLHNGEVHTVTQTTYDTHADEHTAMIGSFAYRNHKFARSNYLQPHERDLAELIEDAPAPTEPAPPAPAGGLVEEIMRKVPGSKEEEIKWTLGIVAEWLKGRQPSHEIELDSIDFAAFLLRMEAIR